MDWTSQTETLLQAVAVPELDPLFWRSDRTDVESAWYGHVPFAHWVVRATTPRCIVELGAHNGVSYSAFCRAVQREKLGTRCFAVDTWEGDEHAGFYDDSVYNGFRAYHDDRFSAFSTLLRRTFDAALEMVADNSVDLLHIDGRHGYADVRHDFEQWRSKMSDRCVVLFHDTNVRDNDFGVWKFWSEIRQDFPHFEFAHGFGLGVLAVGAQRSPALYALTELGDDPTGGTVRERFAQLGERCIFEAQAKMLSKMLGDRSAQRDNALERLTQAEADLDVYRTDHAILQKAVATLHADTEILRNELKTAAATALRTETARHAAVEAQTRINRERLEAIAQGQRQHQHAIMAGQLAVAAERERAATAEAKLQIELDKRIATEQALDAILQSSTWRATWPLRAGLRRMPRWVRRSGRATARLAWRMMTPQLRSVRQQSLVADPAPPPEPIIAPVPPIAPLPPPIAATDFFWTSAEAASPPLVYYISGEPDTPGTIYRVQRYADACRAIGSQVQIVRLDKISAHMADTVRVRLVVIWRAVWTEELEAFMDQARANGARIVFDVDDLMIDPALGTVDIIDGIRSQNFDAAAVQAHYARVQRTMFAADFCTASTDELAGHMRRFGRIARTLPNGFDFAVFEASRMAVRRRLAARPDGLIRLGYASGSRTHQRDFGEISVAIANVLRAHPECRLVMFRDIGDVKLVEVGEFPEMAPFAGQIEWRDLVPLQDLPKEIARFDINLAPLQLGNPFCEAKSELKFFEGALAGVCTVATPVGPFKRAIRDGLNGFLATDSAQWESILLRLVRDPALRQAAAKAALNDVLWPYGPQRRTQLMRRMMAEWMGGPAAADAFVVELDQRINRPHRSAVVPAGETLFQVDNLRQASVTVIIPLYNYAHTVVEALDSVRAQSLAALDLVVVDDCSTDNSLEVALTWARANANRFTRVTVMRNHVNAGLGYTRNAAFAAAETPYVLPLDADNLLRPECCQLLLDAATEAGAAYAYPVIQEFGGRAGVVGTQPYDPSRLIGGNYIDAMALIATSTWSAVGGYAQMRQGWEDYDFWCGVAEMGLYGIGLGGEPQADYRAHDASMLALVTNKDEVLQRVIQEIEQRHPWAMVAKPLVLAMPEAAKTPPLPVAADVESTDTVSAPEVG